MRDVLTGLLRGKLIGSGMDSGDGDQEEKTHIASALLGVSLHLVHSHPLQTWLLQNLGGRVGGSRMRGAEYKSKLMIKTSQVDGRR
jgi:hypothetical protein